MKLYRYASPEESVDISSVDDAKTFILANDLGEGREVYIVEDTATYQVLFKNKRDVFTPEEDLAFIQRQTRPNYLPVILSVLGIVALVAFVPINLQTKFVLSILACVIAVAVEIRSNAKAKLLYLDAKETMASIVANLDEKFKAKGLTRRESQ